MLRSACSRRVTVVLTVAALLCASLPAHAGSPTDRLREFVARVNAILVDPATRDAPLERVVRVRHLVAEIADMSAAAAAALGPEWKARTRAEREEFTAAFAEVLERAYVGRLAGAVRAAGGMMITYVDEAVAGDEATVKTTLRGLGGHDLRVDYRMTLAGGRWRVCDITVDGISTVENYRAQFERVLRRGAYAGLLEQLRAKLSEDTLMFAKTPRSTPAIVSVPPPVAEPDVVPVAPADTSPPVAPRTPIAPAERPAVVALATQPGRAEPLPAAPAKPAPAAFIAARPVPAPVLAAPVPATSVVNDAPSAHVVVPSGVAPGPGAEPDQFGQALGGLLIGAIGAGGALVWPRVSRGVRRTARRPRR